MREQGVIRAWFRKRGFGFIAPDRSGADLFCHLSSRELGALFRPRVGQRVSYVLGTDDKTGRPRAQHVRVAS
jgi:cold shock protein